MVDDIRKFDPKQIAENLVSSNQSKVEQAIADLAEIFSVTKESATSLREGLDTSTIDGINKHFSDLTEFLDLNSRVLKDVIDLHDAKTKIQREKVRVLKEEIDILISTGEVESERYKKLVKAYRESTKILKGQEKYNRSLEKGEKVAEGLLQATLGLQTSWSELGGASARGFFPGIIKGLGQSLTLSNLFGSVVSKVFERIMNYDTAQAAMFQKAAISRDRLNLVNTAAQLGAVSKDVEGLLGESAVTLKNSLRSFGDMSNRQVAETSSTIGVLNRFGVSMQDSAETFVTLTATLGKTPAQANSVMNKFVAVAEAVGRPPSELFSDFKQAAPILTRFGSQSEKIFKDITLQAKNLEMEVAEVLNLSEGMDTFEGAAKAAQSFNLAIGQPFLSAQQLLAADPAEKLQMFADAYEKAGRPDLSPRMLRGLGEDLAMPVDDLQRILKLQKDKFTSKRGEMDTAEATLASNVLKAQNSLTVQEKIDAKITNLIDKLVNLVGGPDMIHDVAVKIANNIELVVAGLAGIGAVAAGINTYNLIRGAHPRVPEYVMDVSGPGGAAAGGKKGKGRGVGRLLGVAAIAAAGTAAASYGVAAFLERDRSEGESKKPIPKPIPTDKPDLTESVTTGAMRQQQEELKKEEESRKKELDFIKKENTITEKAVKSVAQAAEKQKQIEKVQDEKEKKRKVTRTLTQGTLGDYFEFKQSPEYQEYADSGLIGRRRSAFKGKMREKFALRTGALKEVTTVAYEDLATPMSTSDSMANNYISPVFNKKDKFYAAKADGPISKALDDILAVTKKLLEQKGDVELSISERGFAAAIEDALDSVQRR